ncbi:hypothetical protein N7457_001081 [Penicillium paradoxum]|uniref:uncharacterized protein n=1 Tax=Penicillium paradoxum TaxID=176176 RepID=UPI0025467ED1|nr:uncharacterized protein N7457_001081 [Penicillium paradoxum]KAJ5794482.1 hypothetical protein N7457_001081 [Penicillium paradoxum]
MSKVYLESEIILYDLACTQNVCFSPVFWRIRLMLNYKNILYREICLEFPDIEPTLEALCYIRRLTLLFVVGPLLCLFAKPPSRCLSMTGLSPRASASGSKYTAPVIQHVPASTCIMDSVPIARFLDSTATDIELGRDIETRAHASIATVLYFSLVPCEIHILSPRSREYFRPTREDSLGHPLEVLLDGDREERVGNQVNDAMSAVCELVQMHGAEGPSVLGTQPGNTDFFVAGSLRSTRMVGEGIFGPMVKYPGYGRIYACLWPLPSNWQDGRVGLRRTVQVNLIPMVHNCLRVSKGAWVQIPLLSYLFARLIFWGLRIGDF